MKARIGRPSFSGRTLSQAAGLLCVFVVLAIVHFLDQSGPRGRSASAERSSWAGQSSSRAFSSQSIEPGRSGRPQLQTRERGRENAVLLEQLPAEARAVLKQIRTNGPFQFDRDGSVFGNFERLLPEQPRGYYREYTVLTPGIRHRGPRRIVAGRNAERYYTDDHYRSFRKITLPPNDQN